MKMSEELQIIMMNILGGADSFLREYGDEDIFNDWLICGVPDGSTEEDLADIAEDLEDFTDIMECFCRRLRHIIAIEKEG